MGRMVDAVNPANIPADLDGTPALRVTVLADPRGQAFDVEAGNVSPSLVVKAMHTRLAAGQWCVGYVNETTWHELTFAMWATGLDWADAAHWPNPAVYLWAADPSGLIAAGTWRPGRVPLAVQDTYGGGTDGSTCAPNFPGRVAGYVDGPVSQWPPAAWGRFVALPDTANLPPAPPPPAPAPPARPQPSGDVDVRLPILSVGSKGPAVKTVQTLVGGLAVDGVFGPRTAVGVEGFQIRMGLTVDGVVGLHTWGALLGAPQ